MKSINLNEAKIEQLQTDLKAVFERGEVAGEEIGVLYANSEEEICFADKQS